MFKKYILNTLLLIGMAACSYGQQIVPGSTITVTSPDKNLVLSFYQKTTTGNTKAMYYTVSYKHKPVVLESLLDIQLDNHLSEEAMGLKVDSHARWCENLSVQKITTSSNDTSWHPVCGERNVIRDNYNTATIELTKDDNAIYRMNVEIRVYNEGVGMRYFFPENPKGTYYNVVAEHTTFTMPEGTKAWVANWAQGPYRKLPLSNWPDESERPLTLELANGLYACLTEAQMVNYSRTKFKLSNDVPNTIETSMDGPADLVSPIGTPWRVIMVAEKPGDLIENNSIVLNLNEPDKINDSSWIRPGKLIRVMTQNTASAKAYVDFAAAHNLQYILFDWKWYGPAFSFSSDATKVALADLDMPVIINYAKQKNIGVWLYVNMQAMYAQSDSLFAVYRKWGVNGVKIGFVEVGSYRWTTWLEKVIQQAADNHIMLDIHDDWRPTGEQRTWPNLMTAEGVRGNEEMPDATHNTILPFTRFIAGPADYTICYFDKRIKTTHAHQLALAAIYYGPVTTLYWYDGTNNPDVPELEFWDKIPTTWDETKVLQGSPGEYITTARRKGSDWFVGTITNDSARTLKISLSFLPLHAKYEATIYSDDSNVQTATHVKVTHFEVTSATVLNTELLKSGGQAIYLTPSKK